jgi:hypothetical protein
VTIVIGYVVGVILCTGALWFVAGRNFVAQRDPSVNLADTAGKQVGIMSGLAGYAVTGMVLLVTLGRSLSDTSSNAYTTVVAMFFVSWMAYAATAFLFANMTDSDEEARRNPKHGFDVPAAQFAGAAATLEFAFGLGWLALRPLFQAFGLTRLADLVALILVGVAMASYGLVANQLHRSGLGPGRVLVAIPLLTVAAVAVYGLGVGLLGYRSDQAALELIVAGFVVGAVSFTFLVALNVLGAHIRTARWLASDRQLPRSRLRPGERASGRVPAARRPGPRLISRR